MELRQLKWFTVLAEELHYGRAAQRIPVATSALSTTVKKLEQELGVTLIDRGRRAIALTPAGRELAEHAHTLLNAAQNAITAVQFAHHGAPRHIRLGVFQNGAAELNGPLVRSFRAAMRETDLQIVPLDFTNQFSAVIDGAVDLAIVRPPQDDERIELHRLFSEPLSVMVNHRHHLTDALALSHDDIIDEEFVSAAAANVPKSWSSYWTFDDLRGEGARIAKSSGSSVDDMIHAIAQEDGALLATAASVARITVDPEIRHIPLDGGDRRSDVSIATTHDRKPHLDLFVKTARSITSELIDIIPGGQLEFTN